jgi:hypothetical protein
MMCISGFRNFHKEFIDILAERKRRDEEADSIKAKRKALGPENRKRIRACGGCLGSQRRRRTW